MGPLRIVKPSQSRPRTLAGKLPPPVSMVWVGFCLKCDQPFSGKAEQVVCTECSKDLKRRVCH